jgi:hypothetical protein
VPEQQSAVALYDYVYLDRTRIEAYAAQLDDNGVLTSIKRTTASADKTTTKANVNLQVLVAGQDDTVGSTQAVDLAYEARWSVPLDVLAMLDEHGLVIQPVTLANIGQLVLLRGDLEVVDIRVMRELWQPIVNLWQHNEESALRTAQDTLATLPPTQQKQGRAMIADAKKQSKESVAGINLFLPILEKLPHAIHAALSTPDGHHVWMSLDPQNLTTSVDDFALKHGALIPGLWTAIGILDATPEVDRPAPEPGGTLGGIMKFVASFMQNALGRPKESYGLTPIAVYRTIVGPENPINTAPASDDVQ